MSYRVLDFKVLANICCLFSKVGQGHIFKISERVLKHGIHR